MSNPYGAYRPPGQNRSLVAWIGAGVVTIGIALALVWALSVQHNGVRYDPTSLCDVRGPTAVTALLLDATDRISPLQRTAIEDHLKPLLGELQANERLDVFVITDGRDLLQPVFSKCRPVAPGEINQLTGNQRVASQRFETEFKSQLDRQLEALFSQPPADRSPIMEAIQAAAVKSLQAPELRVNAPGFRKQLIVVSDMLENGSGGNHYSGIPDFGTYKRSPEYARVRSDLAGVGVTILYVGRDNARSLQTNAHIDFWESWFRDQGADLKHVSPIEG